MINIYTRQRMVDRVKAAYENLSSNVTMVGKSFEVCGITTSDPKKVRSNDFYQKCMPNALASLEEESDDKDPFDL